MIKPQRELDKHEVKIRPFRQEDLLPLFNLLPHAATFGEVPNLPSTELRGFSEWLIPKIAGQHRFVAYYNNRVLGLAILSQRLRPRLQHSGKITMLVDTRYQHEHVRHLLLTSAIEMADRWLNLSRIQLECPTGNQPAIDYFESSEFEVEGTKRRARFAEGQWVDLALLARLRPGFHPLETQIGTTALEAYAAPGTIARHINDLRIRPVMVEDADVLHQIILDPAIDRTTLQLPSTELSEVQERLKNTASWLHRFVAVADAKIVGSISLVQKSTPGYTHCGHIGMKVHRDYWGLGIGTRLLTTVTDLADDWLNITRIELDVNTDNRAGIQLYKKCGFVIEGTQRYQSYGDNRWADSYFMARINENN